MNVPDIKNFALRMIVHDFAQVSGLPKMKELSRDLLLEVIQAVGELLGEIRFNQDYASISIHSDLWSLLLRCESSYSMKMGRPATKDIHM